eukprot:maker-scaffold_3-augustus-gene-5.41-mRNA-1 protein AED:0.29 eAED:0.30 QI:0/0/0/1/0/0.5/2/0/687
MRAVVCENPSSIAELTVKHIHPKGLDISTPLQRDEVLVEVASAGVSFADLLKLSGKHQNSPGFPHTPGGEVYGNVVKVGSDVSSLSPGDAVFGGCLTGALATYSLCLESSLTKVPKKIHESKDVDLYSLAGFGGNNSTSYHALFGVANLRGKEVVLILGAAGGLGTSAISLSKAVNAIVIAAASTNEKLKVCKELGADYLINYGKNSSKNVLKKKLKELDLYGKVDVVFDSVGGEISEQTIRALGWGGRFLVLGFASGGGEPKSAIPKVPLNLALLNERKILGVNAGHWVRTHPKLAKKDTEMMLSWFLKGKLQVSFDMLSQKSNVSITSNEPINLVLSGNKTKLFFPSTHLSQELAKKFKNSLDKVSSLGHDVVQKLLDSLQEDAKAVTEAIELNRRAEIFKFPVAVSFQKTNFEELETLTKKLKSSFTSFDEIEKLGAKKNVLLERKKKNSPIISSSINSIYDFISTKLDLNEQKSVEWTDRLTKLSAQVAQHLPEDNSRLQLIAAVLDFAQSNRGTFEKIKTERRKAKLYLQDVRRNSEELVVLKQVVQEIETKSEEIMLSYSKQFQDELKKLSVQLKVQDETMQKCVLRDLETFKRLVVRVVNAENHRINEVLKDQLKGQEELDRVKLVYGTENSSLLSSTQATKNQLDLLLGRYVTRMDTFANILNDAFSFEFLYLFSYVYL